MNSRGRGLVLNMSSEAGRELVGTYLIWGLIGCRRLDDFKWGFDFFNIIFWVQVHTGCVVTAHLGWVGVWVVGTRT